MLKSCKACKYGCFLLLAPTKTPITPIHAPNTTEDTFTKKIDEFHMKRRKETRTKCDDTQWNSDNNNHGMVLAVLEFLHETLFARTRVYTLLPLYCRYSININMLWFTRCYFTGYPISVNLRQEYILVDIFAHKTDVKLKLPTYFPWTKWFFQPDFEYQPIFIAFGFLAM